MLNVMSMVYITIQQIFACSLSLWHLNSNSSTNKNRIGKESQLILPKI